MRHHPDFSAEGHAVSQEPAMNIQRELLNDFQSVVYSLQGLHELFLKNLGKTIKASKMLVTVTFHGQSIRKFFKNL